MRKKIVIRNNGQIIRVDSFSIIPEFIKEGFLPLFPTAKRVKRNERKFWTDCALIVYQNTGKKTSLFMFWCDRWKHCKQLLDKQRFRPMYQWLNLLYFVSSFIFTLRTSFTELTDLSLCIHTFSVHHSPVALTAWGRSFPCAQRCQVLEMKEKKKKPQTEKEKEKRYSSIITKY